MNIGRLTLAIIVGVCAVALGWGMMTLLSRVLRTSEPVETNADAPVQPPPSSSPAVPRIQAKLFFISEDGQRLVATEREVPLAEGVVAQARALVDAQLAAEAAPPLARSVPEGTVLRGLYVSSRNEIFVDLDGAVRARHPGGSLNELLTVYAIVNAITVNLPDVQEVQLLIDGREVDTLAGHVDLRQPLRKNESLIQQ
jgi:germination protein M